MKVRTFERMLKAVIPKPARYSDIEVDTERLYICPSLRFKDPGKCTKLSNQVRILLLFVSSCFSFAIAFAEVKLPAVFSDGMVLQQKAKAAVWGWANKGEIITIMSNWEGSKPIITKADASGKWKTTLNTPPAGGPFTIVIKGINTVTLSDVLIGEVWLCSGQSNMGFSLKGVYNAKEEIAAADFPSIRYFSVKRQYGPKEFNDAPGSVWEKTSPETAGHFSAVAYFFARKVHLQKGVPVGLIFNAWGGTPAEAWTPSSVLKGNAALNLYNQRWEDMFKTVGKDSTAYHAAIDEWEAKRKSTDSNKYKRPQEPATLVSFNRPWREPSVLFNGMVSPVIPYAIKGVLWYQGESNVEYAGEYAQLFDSMIKAWRQRWHDTSLPFYFVQIAPFVYNDMEAAATLRDAQQTVANTVPRTAMVTTIDVGNMANIHPTHKKEVGERLAAIALHNLYSEDSVISAGPEVQHISIDGTAIVVQFNKAIKTSDAKDPGGFEIGYWNSGNVHYVPAKAKLDGNKVIVFGDGVQQPVAVRYGWIQIGESNLTGNQAWPVAPFFREIKK